MPEGRMLMKRISDSKKLAQLKTDGARLLYTWLIPHLDINGNFSGDPQVLKGKVFTRLSKSTKTIQQYLNDLHSVGLIVLYETNGDTYLHNPTFVREQPTLRPEREAPPTIPEPTEAQLQHNSGVVTDLPGTSKVKESKVKESKVKHGEFVSLFEGEYEKLVDYMGRPNTDFFLEEINLAIGKNPKCKTARENHYYTAQSWYNRKVRMGEIAKFDRKKHQEKKETIELQKKQEKEAEKNRSTEIDPKGAKVLKQWGITPPKEFLDKKEE